MRTIKDLKEDWKGNIINEATIQKQIADNEGIEFSMTGELIPLKIVEGDLKAEAVKRIKLWTLQRQKFLDIKNINGANCAVQIISEYVEFFNIDMEDLK